MSYLPYAEHGMGYLYQLFRVILYKKPVLYNAMAVYDLPVSTETGIKSLLLESYRQ